MWIAEWRAWGKILVLCHLFFRVWLFPNPGRMLLHKAVASFVQWFLWQNRIFRHSSQCYINFQLSPPSGRSSVTSIHNVSLHGCWIVFCFSTVALLNVYTSKHWRPLLHHSAKIVKMAVWGDHDVLLVSLRQGWVFHSITPGDLWVFLLTYKFSGDGTNLISKVNCKILYIAF